MASLLSPSKSMYVSAWSTPSPLGGTQRSKCTFPSAVVRRKVMGVIWAMVAVRRLVLIHGAPEALTMSERVQGVRLYQQHSPILTWAALRQFVGAAGRLCFSDEEAVRIFGPRTFGFTGTGRSLVEREALRVLRTVKHEHLDDVYAMGVTDARDTLAALQLAAAEQQQQRQDGSCPTTARLTPRLHGVAATPQRSPRLPAVPSPRPVPVTADALRDYVSHTLGLNPAAVDALDGVRNGPPGRVLREADLEKMLAIRPHARRRRSAVTLAAVGDVTHTKGRAQRQNRRPSSELLRNQRTTNTNPTHHQPSGGTATPQATQRRSPSTTRRNTAVWRRSRGTEDPVGDGVFSESGMSPRDDSLWRGGMESTTGSDAGLMEGTMLDASGSDGDAGSTSPEPSGAPPTIAPEVAQLREQVQKIELPPSSLSKAHKALLLDRFSAKTDPLIGHKVFPVRRDRSYTPAETEACIQQREQVERRMQHSQRRAHTATVNFIGASGLAKVTVVEQGGKAPTTVRKTPNSSPTKGSTSPFMDSCGIRDPGTLPKTLRAPPDGRRANPLPSHRPDLVHRLTTPTQPRELRTAGAAPNMPPPRVPVASLPRAVARVADPCRGVKAHPLRELAMTPTFALTSQQRGHAVAATVVEESLRRSRSVAPRRSEGPTPIQTLAAACCRHIQTRLTVTSSPPRGRLALAADTPVSLPPAVGPAFAPTALGAHSLRGSNADAPSRELGPSPSNATTVTSPAAARGSGLPMLRSSAIDDEHALPRSKQPAAAHANDQPPTDSTGAPTARPRPSSEDVVSAVAEPSLRSAEPAVLSATEAHEGTAQPSRRTVDTPKSGRLPHIGSRVSSAGSNAAAHRRQVLHTEDSEAFGCTA